MTKRSSVVMFMHFGQVLGSGMLVQFLHGVAVFVLRLLTCMNVRMRMFMRVGVFVGMRMNRAISVPVLVGMGMRVDVGM